jgi:RNA polymerase sigma factor for flagellar operon FliA
MNMKANLLTARTAVTSTSASAQADPHLEEMLLRYSPMVKIIVARMRDHLPAHADWEELESVGLLGLIAAVERFKPELGYTFETYASIRIRGAILDELRNMDMVPRSIRNKQRRMRQATEILEQKLGRVPRDEEMRDFMGLSERKFEQWKTQSQPMRMVFLDRTQPDDETNIHEAIADETWVPVTERMEQSEMIELVARKIHELPDVQQKVLALYFFEELRLAEIGQILGLSEARVSQIRTQALMHLRRFVERMAAV